MEILFVMSAVICINFLIFIMGAVFGNPINVPAPILHFIKWDYTTAYITTPAIAYQVYFWATYFGLFF